MIELKIAEDEAKALITLIDAAVKTLGLQAAAAAHTIASKVDAAYAEFKKAQTAPASDKAD